MWVKEVFGEVCAENACGVECLGVGVLGMHGKSEMEMRRG